PETRVIVMCKKALVAGLTVIASLLVVNYFWPEAFGHFFVWCKEKREAAQESIPPEKEIARLRMEIEALEKEDGSHFHSVAKQGAEVRELEREADQLREKRDAAEKRIRAIQASLATSGESVVYESKSFKREELTAELRGSARSFRTLEKRLEAKEAERDAKKQGYQLAKENLEEMRLTRDQM